MNQIFATHGILRVVKRDKGPPAENFMKLDTKAIQAAHAEGRDWRNGLYRFL